MSGLGWELRQGSVGREKREKRKGEMQTLLDQWSAVSKYLGGNRNQSQRQQKSTE